MKKIIVVFSIVFTQSVYSQTTMEEWRYMTKGYSIQKESGLDMKKGYELKKMYTSQSTVIGGLKRTFNFIELFRLSDNTTCGIIVEYIKVENGKKSISYFGIPAKYTESEVWNAARESILNFSNKEIGIAYSLALMDLISSKYIYLIDGSALNNSDKSLNVTEQKRKEQEAINKAKDGMFGSNNSTGSDIGTGTTQQGNPGGQGSSGGNSWSLSGRSLSGRLVSPSYDKDVEGKITVNIRVDQSGRVVSASIGSPTTISDAATRNAAVSAAQNTRFTSGKDISTGSITYNFNLR